MDYAQIFDRLVDVYVLFAIVGASALLLSIRNAVWNQFGVSLDFMNRVRPWLLLSLICSIALLLARFGQFICKKAGIGISEHFKRQKLKLRLQELTTFEKRTLHAFASGVDQSDIPVQLTHHAMWFYEDDCHANALVKAGVLQKDDEPLQDSKGSLVRYMFHVDDFVWKVLAQKPELLEQSGEPPPARKSEGT